MIEKIKTSFQKYWKLVLFIFMVLIIICLAFQCQQLQKEVQTKNDDIVVMEQDHATNLNALQNELKINKQNAEILQEEIVKAQNATREPVVTYSEPYSSVDEVIRVTEKRLSESDSTLPTAALEDTDKTVVTAQPNNEEIPVGVYKINTYRNWEMGIGAGVHDGDLYIPVSIQRNYSKSHSVEATVHLSPTEHEISGCEIKYNIHF